MSEPLTPSQAEKAKIEAIPDFVIDAVNSLLSRGELHFLQSTVTEEILKRAPEGTTKADVYNKKWLDFEPIFEKAGWKVAYDRPGYNETYEASFCFTKKRRTR